MAKLNARHPQRTIGISILERQPKLGDLTKTVHADDFHQHKWKSAGNPIQLVRKLESPCDRQKHRSGGKGLEH